uniref:Receptor interacting serine/threonine kinase 1 n=1 Tax=Salvator merianae TaxID=96440 RepID=A0A8D0BV85_SALMN
MSLVDIQMRSEDFLEKEQLDAGGFGMVSLCYHKRHGLVVLKTVYTGPQRTDCNTSLLEEGKLMSKLKHDRVVKLLGIILEDGNYSLVMEYVRKGNLMSVLKATPIPLSVKGRFILEIIEGMLYLTGQGLVHKDLKPENILVDEDFHIKIADLGVACFKTWSRLTKEETSRQMKLKCSSQRNAGTLFYMAPEHLACINTTPVEKSDVYSFGIVLWAIFANKEPYEHAISEMQMCFCVIRGDRPSVDEIEETCPQEIIALMTQAWKQEPDERPTFAEISLTYKPFYQQNLENSVEDDVRKIKEVYPEPRELVKRMESLQVDAVAEPPSGNRMDQPSSLHSSQCPEASNPTDEPQFTAYPVNEPVESCENSWDPEETLERKLQDELNYHVYGNRMDKPESFPTISRSQLQEEERRRRVSHDPYAKTVVTPWTQESYPMSENVRSGAKHTVPKATQYSNLWQPSTVRTSTENKNNVMLSPNVLYGPGPITPPSMEAAYGSHSAIPFHVSKPPVPESGMDHHPKAFNPFFSESRDAESEEPARYNIYNSTGIQIGSYNYLEIKEQDTKIKNTLENAQYNPLDYQKLFESSALASDAHLNPVRENLAKQWKHCARKLGFSNPEIEEIDHDYERDGLKEKVYQMLQRWQMKEGSKGATVGKLSKALHACDRSDLLNILNKIRQESEMSNK